MKTNIKHEGMWWSYTTTCDRCGSSIPSNEWQTSIEPNTEEPDFCLKCLTYFLTNNVLYEDAKKQYGRHRHIDFAKALESLFTPQEHDKEMLHIMEGLLDKNPDFKEQ